MPSISEVNAVLSHAKERLKLFEKSLNENFEKLSEDDKLTCSSLVKPGLTSLLNSLDSFPDLSLGHLDKESKTTILSILEDMDNQKITLVSMPLVRWYFREYGNHADIAYYSLEKVKETFYAAMKTGITA